MPEQNVPLDLVSNLKQSGFSKDQIVDNLQRRGFSMQAIDDAFTQADIQGATEEPPAPQFAQMQRSVLSQPSPSSAAPAFIPRFQPQVQVPEATVASEGVQELVESVIEERWRRAMEEFGDLAAWREKVRTEVTSIKQELLRLETRFDSLQHAVLGKVQDYDRNIGDVGVEVKALQKILEKIIHPLAQNVKDLQKVAEDLKKR